MKRVDLILSVGLILGALGRAGLAAAQNGAPPKAKAPSKTEAAAPGAHEVAWRKLIANVKSQGKKKDDPDGSVLYELEDTRINASGKTQITYHIIIGEVGKLVNAKLTYMEKDIGARFTLGIQFITNASGLPVELSQFHLLEGSTLKEDGSLPYDHKNQALFKSMFDYWAERKP